MNSEQLFIAHFIMIRLYGEIMNDLNRILDIELTEMYYDLYGDKISSAMEWITQ